MATIRTTMKNMFEARGRENDVKQKLKNKFNVGIKNQFRLNQIKQNQLHLRKGLDNRIQRMITKENLQIELDKKKKNILDQYFKKRDEDTKKKTMVYRYVDDGRNRKIKEFIKRNYSVSPSKKKIQSPRLGENY